jgi:hypothetical protein
MSKKTYKVTAATGFDGRAEGEQFEAELDEDLEERAIERGSIEIVKGAKKETKDG